MASDAIIRLKPKRNILENELYRYIFYVEEVNQLVLNGMPFRDAYQEIARQISDGRYKPVHQVNHTHEGSMGNLCNKNISARMKGLMKQFNFKKAKKAFEKLLIC
jgi:argininosuccinate lyase